MRKIALLSLWFLIIPQFAAAQAAFSYADELTVNLYPEYPSPEEEVSMNLEMYTENLSSANISWYKDGKLVAQGTGKTDYSFTAPESGKSTTITINVTTYKGLSFSKSIDIKPANVDILWEGDSYTPPFYKGRSLWAPQGYLRLVAMPSFGQAHKLIYKWTINDQVLENQSGYGKSSISIQENGLSGELKIDLLVTDPAGTVTAGNRLTIPPVRPTIVFYENSPLYGPVFDRALSSLDMQASELSVLSYPFNLDMTLLDSLSYKWLVNSRTVDTDGRAITFRKPDGAGSSKVSLKISSDLKFMQYAEGGFLVRYK